MKLELTSLESAILALESSSAATAAFEATLPAHVVDTLRSGVIQNFEVAYEQSWKMMKRWVEANVSPGAVDGVTRRELFRHAAENQLIQDVNLWMIFHSARNNSSHTYDRATADEVYAVAEQFIPAARALLEALQARND